MMGACFDCLMEIDGEPNRQGVHAINLCPRVGNLISRLQALLAHVGVALGGGDVAVTEEFLHGAQVRTVVEEVRGEGVAQCVRVRR